MFETETAGPCLIRKLKCVCVPLCVCVCMCEGDDTASLVPLSGYSPVTKCKYRISSRGVLIWNNFLSHYEKQIESSSLFKSKIKLKLLAFENEITYF